MTGLLLRLLLVVGLGALAALAAHRAARRSDRAAVALGALGLALVLLQYADPRWDLDRSLPLPDGLLRDALFAPGAMLVGVALAKAREAPRQRVLTGLLVAGYVVFALHDPLWVLAHARGNQAPPTVRDGVVVQRNGVNCVPSSAATVLRRWGLEASDGALALRMHTSYYGTSEHRALVGLREAGAAAGLDAVLVRTTWAELRAIDHPCILLVKLNGVIPHAVALLGLTEREAVVGEPVVGLQRFEPGTLERLKAWEGEAILVGRDLRHDLGPDRRHAVVARARAALALADGAPAGEGEVLDEALAGRVRAFQAARGLPVTGRLEPRTLLALWAILDRGKVPSLGAR